MFTGIVEELGEVKGIERRGKILRLGIKAVKTSEGIRPGDSVSVNGVCLTAIEIKSKNIFFDCIEETLRLTNLGKLGVKDIVNLEKALKADGLLSGHIVLGHIDECGKISRIIKHYGETVFYIGVSSEILDYLVPKGSVAIDGVSLTVCDIGSNHFTVKLIPYTLEITTLGLKTAGEWVNIEVDILAKYVKKFPLTDRVQKKDITLEFLRLHGFA
jgi:riboflavin synthase